MALWSADLPVVATFHTANERSRAMSSVAAVLRPSLEKISARIAVSETARQTLVRHLGGEPVVIPNGIFVDQFAGAPQREPQWQHPGPDDRLPRSRGRAAQGSRRPAGGDAADPADGIRMPACWSPAVARGIRAELGRLTEAEKAQLLVVAGGVRRPADRGGELRDRAARGDGGRRTSGGEPPAGVRRCHAGRSRCRTLRDQAMPTTLPARSRGSSTTESVGEALRASARARRTPLRLVADRAGHRGRLRRGPRGADEDEADDDGLGARSAVVVAAVLVGLWCAWTATRLDRMHLLLDSASAALAAALVRRSAVATDVALSQALDPASSLALLDAAVAAREGPRDDWQAQSDLSAVIRMVRDAGSTVERDEPARPRVSRSVDGQAHPQRPRGACPGPASPPPGPLVSAGRPRSLAANDRVRRLGRSAASPACASAKRPVAIVDLARQVAPASPGSLRRTRQGPRSSA